jgi:cathepsin L
MRCINILLLLSVGASYALSENIVQREFATFKAKYSKTYASYDEEVLRYEIFQYNFQQVMKQNKMMKPYTVGITQFSDLTHQEFKDQYLGYKNPSNVHSLNKKTIEDHVYSTKDLPESVDWREKGAISKVKNQGQCGSCWAFATTEMIESYAQISSQDMVELSTQQVTSCTPNPVNCGGTGGCRGSIAQLGFNYIQLFGHTTEESWPYVSGSNGQTGSCDFDMENTTPVVTLKGYDTLPPNNQEAVMNHLANVGPLAINVDASEWHTYTGGIFDGCDFTQNIEINHVVQLVGYTPDAWIVRNSWSNGWGEEGYIRLAKTAQPECGTDSSPLMGTGCEGGPGNDVQHVCGQCGMLFDASYPLGAESVHAPRK